MSSIIAWQDDRDKGSGSNHEAASMAHEHLILLTDRMNVECEEQRRITNEMMDEKLHAVMEEVNERLRRMKDDMQAQMESRLDSQREATQVLLSKTGENTQLLVQSHRRGIEDRLEAQHRGFEERLAALTVAPAPLPEQDATMTPQTSARRQEQQEMLAPEAMTEEAAERLEAFRLLEWRVGELIKRERMAFRNATSSMVMALQQDRADREEMENRLEQTAEACRKAAHDTRAALDLGLADHASMVRALREELGRRGVTTELPSEGQQSAWQRQPIDGRAGAPNNGARSDADGGPSTSLRIPGAGNRRAPGSPRSEERIIVV